MKDYPNYGLKPGDKVKVTKGHGCNAEPNKVVVVREYPTYILLKFFFEHWDRTDSYLKCMNKGMLISGDVVMTTVAGGAI